jgi:hypothetical protein
MTFVPTGAVPDEQVIGDNGWGWLPPPPPPIDWKLKLPWSPPAPTKS